MPRKPVRLVLSLAALLTSAGTAGAFQTFVVPSESMVPTLFVDDRATVVSWGGGAPERGEIVVFEARGYVQIARVVAIPGDTVAVVGGTVVLNGEPLAQTPVEPIEGGCLGLGDRCDFTRETLPGGVSYIVLNRQDGSPGDDVDAVTVPDERYFLMGDNRDNAADSRFGPEMNGVGFVPADAIRGAIDFLWPNGDRASGSSRLAGYPDHH